MSRFFSLNKTGLLGRSYSTSSKALQDKTSRFQIPKEKHSFPKGFLASGVHSGIKKSGALDLGLLVSAHPTSSAACFTKNVFKAAPVQVSRELLLEPSKYDTRSFVVNSGCANAVTGKQGLKDAQDMSISAANFQQGSSQNEGKERRAFVMSTGVIGQNLPRNYVLSGIESAKQTLSSSYESWDALSKAFMTTDTFPKLLTKTLKIGDKDVRLVGIDKGAGMIHPNMGPPHATLLGFIGTDASIDQQSLQNALTYAIERSFNSISVDGDMSTNDTVIAMANGASGSPPISESQTPEEFIKFRDELTAFATELATLIVRDGEGATKFVKISVEEAPTFKGAHHIASKISRSPLVKTALYGEDANWGRILCAIGYSNPDFNIDPTSVSVSFMPTDGSPELKLLINGEPEKVDEVRAKEILSLEDLEIRVTLGLGKESAAYYTCDLTKGYIEINGDYRS